MENGNPTQSISAGIVWNLPIIHHRSSSLDVGQNHPTLLSQTQWVQRESHLGWNPLWWIVFRGIPHNAHPTHHPTHPPLALLCSLCCFCWPHKTAGQDGGTLVEKRGLLGAATIEIETDSPVTFLLERKGGLGIIPPSTPITNWCQPHVFHGSVPSRSNSCLLFPLVSFCHLSPQVELWPSHPAGPRGPCWVGPTHSPAGSTQTKQAAEERKRVEGPIHVGKLACPKFLLFGVCFVVLYVCGNFDDQEFPTRLRTHFNILISDSKDCLSSLANSLFIIFNALFYYAPSVSLYQFLLFFFFKSQNRHSSQS